MEVNRLFYILGVLLPCFFCGTVSAQGSPVGCKPQADIVFVVDSSGSVTDTEYQLLQQFVTKVATNFKVGPHDVQFSALLFSDKVSNLFYFNQVSTIGDITKRILNTPRLHSSTATDKALEFVTKNTLTTKNGMRPNVPHIVILITDGMSDSFIATRDASTNLKKTGAEVLAIGIGDDVDKDELDVIASDPKHVLTVTKFNLLITFIDLTTDNICQVESPVGCKPQADIVFIMDSSGSVKDADYQTLLQFVAKVATNFKVGPQDVQFSALLFSDLVSNLFFFNQVGAISDITKRILRAPRLHTTTATGKALEFVRKYTLTTKNGMRPNVPLVVILLTDGVSDSFSDTKDASTNLKKTGAKVLAIGIGDDVDKDELDVIASDPKHVLTVTKFNLLNTFINIIIDNICQVVATTPSSTVMPRVPRI